VGEQGRDLGSWALEIGSGWGGEWSAEGVVCSAGAEALGGVGGCTEGRGLGGGRACIACDGEGDEKTDRQGCLSLSERPVNLLFFPVGPVDRMWATLLPSNLIIIIHSGLWCGVKQCVTSTLTISAHTHTVILSL
jgi:hypothetical protein